MPSWFSKVFKAKPTSSGPSRPSLDELMGGIDTSEDPEPEQLAGPPKKRRVVNAPILEEAVETETWSADVRIKARVEKDKGACVLMLDRPVLEGNSAWFPNAQKAELSPLAQAIFSIDGVESVLLHGYTITITRRPTMHGDWKPMAQEVGNVVRTHLVDGSPVVTDTFLEGLPSSDEIVVTLQRVIDTEINPSIAAHSGAIALDRVEGNTVFIQMMGGCQGCAASDVTLRQGIYEAFRSAVPQIGAILDNTDHGAGKSPFYKALPAGIN
ncbi:MAG TPA: NifU family protein [Candidatus Hydrogenedentes bacterium]|nr:NifU family protein [Candidatus Hydrogenedentota bacterium]